MYFGRALVSAVATAASVKSGNALQVKQDFGDTVTGLQQNQILPAEHSKDVLSEQAKLAHGKAVEWSFEGTNDSPATLSPHREMLEFARYGDKNPAWQKSFIELLGDRTVQLMALKVLVEHLDKPEMRALPTDPSKDADWFDGIHAAMQYTIPGYHAMNALKDGGGIDKIASKGIIAVNHYNLAVETREILEKIKQIQLGNEHNSANTPNNEAERAAIVQEISHLLEGHSGKFLNDTKEFATSSALYFMMKWFIGYIERMEIERFMVFRNQNAA